MCNRHRYRMVGERSWLLKDWRGPAVRAGRTYSPALARVHALAGARVRSVALGRVCCAARRARAECAAWVLARSCAPSERPNAACPCASWVRGCPRPRGCASCALGRPRGRGGGRVWRVRVRASRVPASCAPRGVRRVRVACARVPLMSFGVGRLAGGRPAAHRSGAAVRRS